MALFRPMTLRAAARCARLFNTDSGACITQSVRVYLAWKDPPASIASTRTTRRRRTFSFRPPPFGRQSLGSCHNAVGRRWQSTDAKVDESGDVGDTIQKQGRIDQQGIFRLLNDDERELLRMQRELTSEARSVATKVGISLASYAGWGSFLNDNSSMKSGTEDENENDTSANDTVDSTFCVVVAGEYNAGKSTLINALLGQRLLETGSLPTTDGLIVISYDHSNQQSIVASSRESSSNLVSPTSRIDQPNPATSVVQVKRTRVPLLQDLTIVDTPGTNAVLTDHTALTVRILPAADLILFVTSADRPFPESERLLLESIAQHFRKNIVLVINKMDVLDTSGGLHGNVEKDRVTAYVTEHAQALLGARPVVLAVSARDAWAARHGHQMQQAPSTESSSSSHLMNSTLWQRSNFAALEQFLHENLSTGTKIKAKLSSPVGLVLGMLDECKATLDREQKALEVDVTTLQLLDNQLQAWRTEMNVTMDRAVDEMQNVLELEGARASVLLERAGLWNFYRWSVFDTNKLQHEWLQTKPLTLPLPNSNVSTPTTSTSVQAVVQDLVRDTADTVATRGRTQGQSIIEFLGKRPAVHHQSLVGSVTAASSFADTQRALQDTLNQAVQRHVTLDLESTASQSLLQNLQRTAWLSLALNAASVGSAAWATAAVLAASPGAAVLAASPGAALLDFGLVGVPLSWTATFALSSALVIQTGRRHFASNYQALWSKHGQRFREDVTAICAKEAERIERRISDGVAPYTRFVESEQKRLEQLMDQCGNLTISAHRLQKRIANL